MISPGGPVSESPNDRRSPAFAQPSFLDDGSSRSLQRASSPADHNAHKRLSGYIEQIKQQNHLQHNADNKSKSLNERIEEIRRKNQAAEERHRMVQEEARMAGQSQLDSADKETGVAATLSRVTGMHVDEAGKSRREALAVERHAEDEQRQFSPMRRSAQKPFREPRSSRTRVPTRQQQQLGGSDRRHQTEHQKGWQDNRRGQWQEDRRGDSRRTRERSHYTGRGESRQLSSPTGHGGHERQPRSLQSAVFPGNDRRDRSELPRAISPTAQKPMPSKANAAGSTAAPERTNGDNNQLSIAKQVTGGLGIGTTRQSRTETGQAGVRSQTPSEPVACAGRGRRRGRARGKFVPSSIRPGGLSQVSKSPPSGGIVRDGSDTSCSSTAAADAKLCNDHLGKSNHEVQRSEDRDALCPGGQPKAELTRNQQSCHTEHLGNSPDTTERLPAVADSTVTVADEKDSSERSREVSDDKTRLQEEANGDNIKEKSQSNEFVNLDEAEQKVNDDNDSGNIDVWEPESTATSLDSSKPPLADEEAVEKKKITSSSSLTFDDGQEPVSCWADLPSPDIDTGSTYLFQ